MLNSVVVLVFCSTIALLCACADGLSNPALTGNRFNPCDYKRTVRLTSQGALLGTQWIAHCADVYKSHAHDITHLQRVLTTLCLVAHFCYAKYKHLNNKAHAEEFKTQAADCALKLYQIRGVRMNREKLVAFDLPEHYEVMEQVRNCTTKLKLPEDVNVWIALLSWVRETFV